MQIAKRIQPLLLAVAAMLVLLGAVRTAAAEPRIALVIGNEAYANVSPLDNPVADARLLATALEERGFSVTLLTDADQLALNRAVAQFGRDLRASGKETVGLFYYAGHAVQSFGANFLLPVDVALTDAADLSLVAVRADAVLRQMASAANRTNLVILDACRNNPFVSIPDMNDNGLAEMKAPTGTFMTYSTAPGSVALDGSGSNSPFTAALVAEMGTAGQGVEQMFKRVRSTVLSETGGRQTPWDTSSLTADFQFTPQEQVSPQELAARKFFETIQQTRDPMQIVVFLQTYPESSLFDEARALLGEVIGSDPAATATSTPPPQTSTDGSPSEDEQALISAAQASGELSDYRAYLEAFPNGVFAELAAIEIASKTAKDPDAPVGGLAAAVISAPPAPRQDDAGQAAVLDLDMKTLLPLDDPALSGQSIATLIEGSPLFPPIEGLPEAVWKDKTCSNCHQWTQEALCTQANTYLSASGTRAIGKEHPYGGGFKRVLRDWAGGGCR